MNPAALQRFEQSVRASGDVEAALDELDQDLAPQEASSLDIGQTIRNAALRALQDEQAGLT